MTFIILALLFYEYMYRGVQVLTLCAEMCFSKP